jgi:hypothetical protein
MDAPNPTVSNSALWAEYLHRQWSWWLEPGGIRAITATLGASIANAQALWLEAVIGRLYADNAPDVTHFAERVAEVRREGERRERALAAGDHVPPWLTANEAAHDAPVEDASVGAVISGTYSPVP